MTLTSQSQELFNDPKVKEFFKTEAAKVAKTGLIPALALDAFGVFGKYDSIDSLLTPAVAIGGMAGYYGGRNHWFDGPLVAGAALGVAQVGASLTDFFRDYKFNEAPSGLVNYLVAYTLAALAGKTVQVIKNAVKSISAERLVLDPGSKANP